MSSIKSCTAVLLVVFMIFLVGCATSGGQDVEKFNIKEEVTVGKSVWRVLKVEKEKKIGNRGAGLKAEGAFIIIEVEVKNLSSDEFMITGIETEIIDDKNKSYSFDVKNCNMYLKELNREGLTNQSVGPDKTSTGWIVYDINQDAEGLSLRVRDLDIRSDKKSLIDLNL